jgi:hypothetical protein
MNVQWRKLHLQMMDGKKPFRPFENKSISSEDANEIAELLAMNSDDFEKTKKIFSAAIEYMENSNGSE